MIKLTFRTLTDDSLCAARKGPRTIDELNVVAGCDMKSHIRRFLYEQAPPESDLSGADTNLQDCPYFSGRFSIFDSAVATYYSQIPLYA